MSSRADGLRIGGLPPVTLRAEARPGEDSIIEATVLPGRGGMLLQATVLRADGRREALLHAPSPEDAAARLDGGEADFAGNASFAFGGAILAPYANRIRGRALPDRRGIETMIDGHAVRLPRNWGGKAPGAAQYAMHGLILNRPFEVVRDSGHSVELALDAGDFGCGWPGRARLTIAWSLVDGGLALALSATNLGDVDLPFAAGWHPYFRLPSGDRRQAVLQTPGAFRVEVNDYDEVLPTGRLLDATPFEAALGETYLDDCFTGPGAPGGNATVVLTDPAADYAVTVRAPAPPVRAFQVYAPVNEAFVVIEPQTNLADPYGEQWPPNLDTGMARIAPGTTFVYRADVRAGRAT